MPFFLVCFVGFFSFPLCSHIVIIKSLKGPIWDPHLGLIAILDVIRARMVSNQMVTKKIFVKVSCKKVKLGFSMSPRAHARTAKAGSSVTWEKLNSPQTSWKWPPWGLLIPSWVVAQLNIVFTILGKAVVCFGLSLLRCGLWVDWSLFWHPKGWNVCVDNQITQRKRRIYWHPHSRACLSSPHLHHCPARERVINVPPLVGTKLEGLLLLASLVCAVNSSESGYTRYLHSHNEADDTAKELFSGLVLGLRTCVFFLYGIQEYAFILCGLSMLVEYKWQKTNVLDRQWSLISEQQYVDLYHLRKEPKGFFVCLFVSASWGRRERCLIKLGKFPWMTAISLIRW